MAALDALKLLAMIRLLTQPFFGLWERISVCSVCEVFSSSPSRMLMYNFLYNVDCEMYISLLMRLNYKLCLILQLLLHMHSLIILSKLFFCFICFQSLDLTLSYPYCYHMTVLQKTFYKQNYYASRFPEYKYECKQAFKLCI